MQKHLFIIAAVFLITTHVVAQSQLTLKECVSYAIDNNLELLQKYNSLNTQELNVLQSKAAFLPGVTGSTNLNMSFGRSIDANTNAVTFDETLGNDFDIEASIHLFQGLVKYNNVLFQKYLLSASTQETQYAKNCLVFDVLSAYYTLHFSIGVMEVANNQVALSEEQFNRMQKLVDVGKESPIMVQDLKSQWASDKLSLILAENTVRSKILDLQQLLRLKSKPEIAIGAISISSQIIKSNIDIDSVCNVAMNLMPEIKEQEFLLDASYKDLAISKGYATPQLYFQAGFGTNFYDSDSLIYSTQLTNNQYQWLTIGVQIPIFGKLTHYCNIKKKKLAVINQELRLDQKKEDVYAEVLKAIDDLQSVKIEYESSVEVKKHSSLTLDNVTKKMEKGLANATDYEVAKQRFTESEVALLKSKLLFVMRNQILGFYMTGNWEHL